jgi:putative ABC transport system permease protein
MRARAARLRSGWLALAGSGAAAGASLALLVFLTVFVAAAGARVATAGPTRVLREGLAQLPQSEKAVLGTDSYGDLAQAEGPVGPSQLSGFRALLRQHLAGARLPLAPGRADWSGLTTGYSEVTAGGRGAFDGPTPPQLEFVYRDALGQYARRVAGRLPDTASLGSGGVVLQVAVTTATARRFTLAVGSRLRMDPGLTLVVTGIIRPAATSSAFWAIDSVTAAPTHAAPRNEPPYWQGAVFVGPAELRLLESATDISAIQLSWGFPLALGDLTGDQAGALQDQLAGALGNLGEITVNPPLLIGLSAGVAGFLEAFSLERAAIAGVLDLLIVSLAAIGVVVVLLGTLMLAQRRRGDFALLHARGAARWQLAVLALRSAALAAVPAAVAGTAAAVAVTPGAASSLAWLLAALTLAAALAGLPLFTAGSQRSPARAGQRPPDRRTLRRRAAVRRLVVEVTLIAVAAGGLVVARRQGVSGLSADLLTSAAPVLVAIPAAIVAMRCYPLLARWLLRAAGQRRGVIVYVGLARAARVSLTSILPAFALVLALVVVSFGGLVRAAITRGEVAASWQQTGADATIDTLDSSLPLTPAALRAIAAVPGVRRTATVTMTTGVQANGTQVAVAIVNPGQYAALIADTPGAGFPAAALAREAGGGAGGGPVPAVATPAAASAIGQLSAVLALGTTGRRVAIRVVRTAVSDPAISARADGPVVILPQWAAGAAPQPPNLMLVTGPRLDGRRLAAVARRVVPGATVSLRSAALAALARAPLPHGAYVAYAGGVLVAAGFGIVVLLIALLLSAGSRDATLARLAAMGLSSRQGGWLALVETLPQIVVATACGTGCAWALAAIVGPDLDLSPFTGSGAGVQIRADPATLGAAAAGLLVIAMLTLIGEVIVTRRRGVARPLRIGE